MIPDNICSLNLVLLSFDMWNKHIWSIIPKGLAYSRSQDVHKYSTIYYAHICLGWKWMIFMAEKIFKSSYSCLVCNIVLKREREERPVLLLSETCAFVHWTVVLYSWWWFLQLVDIDLKLYSSTIVLYCCWSFYCIVVRQWIDCLSMISFEWTLGRSWLSSSNGLPMPVITLISACTGVANTCSFWVAPFCSWEFLWMSLSMLSLFPIMAMRKIMVWMKDEG